MTFAPCTTSQLLPLSLHAVVSSTICCGITNGDIPNWNNLQWVLLALRARGRFRPHSFPLKSLTTEEHNNLSIKGRSALRTSILWSSLTGSCQGILKQAGQANSTLSSWKQSVSLHVCYSRHKRCPDTDGKCGNISRILQKQWNQCSYRANVRILYICS